MIRQVEYQGNNYYYKSPELKTGLNIIEGRNGTGKTTFIDLICYALGIYVREFDERSSEPHIEVCSDTENYVVIKSEINKKKYLIKRFFRSNLIFVQDGVDIKELPIFRTGGESFTFSDWLMGKLGIPVVAITQGAKTIKVNFPDLFRLIHYDQDTPPQKIYKAHRNDDNFVADSKFVREVIFQILLGTTFTKYYQQVGEVIKLEREKETKKSVLENYDGILRQTGFINLPEQNVILDKLNSTKTNLSKAELYRNNLKNSDYTVANVKDQLERMRKALVDIEVRYGEKSVKKIELLQECKNINELKQEIILEVTQLQKIILAHEELNLFSPDTCPNCLKQVKRKENHCICGSPIDESEYERFFYTSDEYLDILHSKQKSVDTVEDALLSCKQEIEETEGQLSQLELERSKLRGEINSLGNIAQARNSEYNDANDNILQLQKEIQLLEQQLEMKKKLAELKDDYLGTKKQFDEANQKLTILEQQARLMIEQKLKQFNQIYNNLMTTSLKEVNKARLDDSYMPIINDGQYMEASSSVPKRFMYYLTMLNMSLIDNDMLFPKFLLIDTPENLGIDTDHLEDCMLKILEGKDSVSQLQFQVILTTGENKYPQQFGKYVIGTLTEDNKLLQRKDG